MSPTTSPHGTAELLGDRDGAGRMRWGQRWRRPRAGDRNGAGRVRGTEAELAELWPSAPLCGMVLGQQRWGHPEAGTRGRVLLRTRTRVTHCPAQWAGSRCGTWGRCLSSEAQRALVPRAPPRGPTSPLGSTKHRNGGPPAGLGQEGDREGWRPPPQTCLWGPRLPSAGSGPLGICPGPAPPTRTLELWGAS